MANSFTVMDMLNQNTKAGIDDSPKARFRTKDISIFKMYRNEMNFYKVADIEELAGDILMHGLKQNLELVYKPCKEGEYRIVSGERRWEALKSLAAKGYKEFEVATCKLTSPQDDDEEQVEIISANAYRTKRIADILEEEQRLKASLERMRAAGRQVKGYDLNSGRLRDVVASMMGVSRTKVAQIESVNNNLILEFKEELNKERLTFSAAYELSGMPEEKQRETYDSYQVAGGITHKAVKDMKKEKYEVAEAVSESDTKEYVPDEERHQSSAMQVPECRPGDDYEDPHPESITSLCYSCKRYSECNVKTGTCKKCDQYINKAEAEKTEEQRYSEEQDRIDRETRKKLREMEDEEKMKHLPSDMQKRGKKLHQVKIASQFFMDVCIGRKTFELRKNDRDYEVGDLLEMFEYKDGKCTERAVRAWISYILENYKGLEDGYCILGINVTSEWYYATEESGQQVNQE